MTVTVILSRAVICFMSQCHPILYGVDTPTGTFDMTERYVLAPGYGGNVIQFDENDKQVFSIHRIWNGRPQEHREERINSPRLSDRAISKGCINVEPEVFEKLRDCCINDKLVIKK